MSVDSKGQHAEVANLNVDRLNASYEIISMLHWKVYTTYKAMKLVIYGQDTNVTTARNSDNFVVDLDTSLMQFFFRSMEVHGCMLSVHAQKSFTIGHTFEEIPPM